MVNKKKIEHAVSTLGYWCATIGIPLCVIGVGIVMFSGVFGKDPIIGTLMSVSGVAITSFILPCIVIKLLIDDSLGGEQ